MTTEEAAIQAALDAHPEDWQSRLVLGDHLDEVDDPRGPGYRALGACRVWPFLAGRLGVWVYHNGRGTTGPGFTSIPDAHRLPSQRWLDLTQDEEYDALDAARGKRPRAYRSANTVLSSCLAEGRRFAEDAAARAFLRLEPAERAAMLAGGRL